VKVICVVAPLAAGAIGAGAAAVIAFASAVSRLTNDAISIAERGASYLIIKGTMEELKNKVDLDYMIDNIIADEQQRNEIKAIMHSKDKGMNALRFTEFLKDINFYVNDIALQAGVLHPYMGNVVSRQWSAISWAYGLGWLSWVALSPIMNKVVAEPTDRALDETFRTRFITRSDIDKLYKLGLIDIEAYKALLAKLGYSDEAIEKYVSVLTAEKTEKEKDLTKSEILRAYKKGILTATDARVQLRALGYSDDEINILLELYTVTAEVDKKTETKEVTKSTILRAYRYNVIDKEEAVSRLRELGYSDKDIEIMLSIEDARKRLDNREKDRDLTRSDILKGYELGLLTWDEAKELLIDLGYDESEAEYLLTIRTILVMKRAGVGTTEATTEEKA